MVFFYAFLKITVESLDLSYIAAMFAPPYNCIPANAVLGCPSICFSFASFKFARLIKGPNIYDRHLNYSQDLESQIGCIPIKRTKSNQILNLR